MHPRRAGRCRRDRPRDRPRASAPALGPNPWVRPPASRRPGPRRPSGGRFGRRTRSFPGPPSPQTHRIGMTQWPRPYLAGCSNVHVKGPVRPPCLAGCPSCVAPGNPGASPPRRPAVNRSGRHSSSGTYVPHPLRALPLLQESTNAAPLLPIVTAPHHGWPSPRRSASLGLPPETPLRPRKAAADRTGERRRSRVESSERRPWVAPPAEAGPARSRGAGHGSSYGIGPWYGVGSSGQFTSDAHDPRSTLRGTPPPCRPSRHCCRAPAPGRPGEVRLTAVHLDRNPSSGRGLHQSRGRWP